MFWAPMLAGAALGVAKNQLVDKPRAEAQNRAAAVQTQFSPWTKMGMGQTTQAPSALGAAMQGGMAGAQLGQAYGKFKADELKNLMSQGYSQQGAGLVSGQNVPDISQSGGSIVDKVSAPMQPKQPTIYQQMQNTAFGNPSSMMNKNYMMS